MTAQFSEDDHEYMAQALRLAQRGLYTTDPNPRVGCVIVHDNKIVVQAWHQRAGAPHAEILALKAAGNKAHGATVYVSLEPCCHHGRTGPCVEALIAAKVGRVIAAVQDPNPEVAGSGVLALQQAGIDACCGLLAQQAKALNCGFFQRMQSGRPYVRLKMAMSLDGRTALANGDSKWITGVAARRDVHHWRGRSSAILTGIGTVLADDPAMNCRLSEFDGDLKQIEQPAVVILDSKLRITSNAKILGIKRPVWIFTKAQAVHQLPAHVHCLPCKSGPDGLDLREVLLQLGQRQVNEVMIEAGSTLAGSFFQAGLVDEIQLYVAPTFLGNTAKGLLSLPVLENMQQRFNVKIDDIRHFGDDLRLTITPKARTVNESER